MILSRPEARNAVDPATAAELVAAFEAFEADDEARVGVFFGDHGTFCAGADLKVFAGGLELALWCDVRVVEEDAVFGVFCRRWGVPLIDGGTVRLPRIVGHGRALDMILTGRPVKADEALAFGLANRVVPKGEAKRAAEQLAADIAAFPALCVKSDRQSAYEQWDLPLCAERKSGARPEVRLQTALVRTADVLRQLDVYKPERWLDDALFRPEVRSAFHGLIAQGWTDALRTLHPGEAIYTFWDYFRNAWGRNAGLRIDHLLVNPVAAGRLAAANVDRDVRGWDKASDHAPVWIKIAEADEKKRHARPNRKRAKQRFAS